MMGRRKRREMRKGGGMVWGGKEGTEGGLRMCMCRGKDKREGGKREGVHGKERRGWGPEGRMDVGAGVECQREEVGRRWADC